MLTLRKRSANAVADILSCYSFMDKSVCNGNLDWFVTPSFVDGYVNVDKAACACLSLNPSPWCTHVLDYYHAITFSFHLLSVHCFVVRYQVLH